jgi:hypothetical protein
MAELGEWRVEVESENHYVQLYKQFLIYPDSGERRLESLEMRPTISARIVRLILLLASERLKLQEHVK